MSWNLRRAIGRMIVATTLVIAVAPASRVSAAWDPAAFANEDTVQLTTHCPDEGEYSFPVWLVVVDDQLYLRLGTRAADRIECNASKPKLRIEIAGQKFEVTAMSAPEVADRVAQAMAAKYLSDWFIRWFPHPLTLRLVPEP